MLAESAGPLLVTAAASAIAGHVVAALLLVDVDGGAPQHLYVAPPAGYWVSLVGGLALALALVSATLPLLDRMTSLEAVRFE